MNARELRDLAEVEHRNARMWRQMAESMKAEKCDMRAEELERKAKQAERRNNVQWRG